LQTFALDLFLRLYVAGSDAEGQVVKHPLQTQTPQFLQWPALRKTVNLASQMKQLGDSEKGSIFGGAFAIADSFASGSEGKENALRNLEALAGLVATPLWLVLIVVIHKFVASLW
jgi:hypothetical protein